MFPENLAEGETQMRGCEWPPGWGSGWRVGRLVTVTLMGLQEIAAGSVVGGLGILDPWPQLPFPGVPYCLSRCSQDPLEGGCAHLGSRLGWGILRGAP